MRVDGNTGRVSETLAGANGAARVQIATFIDSKRSLHCACGRRPRRRG